MTIHSENQQQTLSVLLTRLDPSWISLLDAEGIEWTAIGADNCTDAFEEFSVLIIPKDTPKTVIKYAYASASQGAAIIWEPGCEPTQNLQQPSSWQMPYENKYFCGTDTDDPCAVTVQRGKLGKSDGFGLPFCLGPLWESWQRARRFIAVGNGQVVHEDMTAVVKKNVRRVILEVIEQAFFCQGLPFVHKWFFPGGNRSVLCFRGDADGGPKENFQQWLDAVRPFASCTAVFFCTSRYTDKTDLITAAEKAGLEVGSHNHWHIVFPDTITNALSLKRAEKILGRFAGHPKGFVAPAFFWHPSLYRLLEKRGYQYASCFRIHHDSIPCYPVVGGKPGKVLELPFHCLGDRFPLSSIPLEGEHTRHFFTSLICKKHAAGEPIFLYGHPDVDGRMGTTPELVRFILKTAMQFTDVYPMQPDAFAGWWHKRNNTRMKFAYDIKTDRLKMQVIPKNLHTDDMMVRVVFPDGKPYLAPVSTSPSQNLSRDDMLPFAPLQRPAACDTGEVVYKGPDDRLSWFDWRTRKQLKRFATAYYEVYTSLFNDHNRQP